MEPGLGFVSGVIHHLYGCVTVPYSLDPSTRMLQPTTPSYTFKLGGYPRYWKLLIWSDKGKFNSVIAC